MPKQQNTTLLKRQTKKQIMLVALKKSLGNVSSSCEKAQIFRSTHYDWMKDDPEYSQAVKDIAASAVDFAESQLLKSIQNGSDTATIFFLKTKGKDRGYVETQENINKTIVVSIDE